MEVLLSTEDGAALEDCYVCVRVGDIQRQVKHGNSRPLPFPAEPSIHLGRVRILKVVGSAVLNLDPNVTGDRDVRVNCSDGLGEVALKVGVNFGSNAAREVPAKQQDPDNEKYKSKVAEMKTQLAKSDIQQILTQGVKAVLRESPDNPRQFLADWLSRDDPGAAPAAPAKAPEPFVPYTHRPSIGTWLSFLPAQERAVLPSEFEVVLDRSGGEALGFEVSGANQVSLEVTQLSQEGGLLGAWVCKNRSTPVVPGDHIIEINGVRANSNQLLRESEQAKKLHMTIRKGHDFEVKRDCSWWAHELKGQMGNFSKKHGRSIVPCVGMGDDEIADILAQYDEDKDGKLNAREFTKLARERLWHMTKLQKEDEALYQSKAYQDSDSEEDDTDSDDGYGSNPVPGALKPKPTPQPNNFRLGIYQRADENALGALSVRHEMEASGGNTKTFIFTVTSAKGDRDHEMWSAELEPAGMDSLGRGMWKLSGHTSPSMFLMAESDNTHLVECSYFDVPLPMTSCLDEGSGTTVCSGVRRVTRTKERHVWEFQEELFGMFFSEPVGLPIEHRSKNFTTAVIEKDPTTNEPDAPDTQTVVSRFANYRQKLPETPIKRQMALVNLYTMETSLYHEMNKALRDDDLEKLKLLGAYIKELRDVFLTDHEYQIIKPFRGTVWRGISRVPDIDKAKRTYVPGKDFLWTAFTSTTTKKSVAMNWGQIVFEIKCDPPDGMYADEVFEYAPADVKEFSAYASEDEVLFPPNVKFRVMAVTEENGKPLISCVATALDGVGGLVEFGGNQDPCLVEDETQTPRVDDTILRKLTEMGQPELRARKALRATRTTGTLEAAKEWITSHEDDPDIDSPIALDPSTKAVLRRVQSRPKIGFFLSEAGDVGRLYIQKARGGKKRAYIFSIIEASKGGLVWVACLQHKGHDPAGRDMWSLDGHPEGGVFLNDKGNFLECDDDNVHRHAWTFHGDKYNRNASAPWENNFLQDQLKKAKETKKLLTWWKDASELDPEAQQALEEQLMKVDQVKKLLSSIHKADMQLVKTDKGILKRETTQHLMQRLHI